MDYQDGVYAVVGAGAVGCYYGGRLFHSGRNVHFLLRRDYQHALLEGIKVRSCDGDFAMRPPVYRSVQEMPPADVVLVTLKGTSTSDLADLLPPLLKETTSVLCLQNGLGNEEVIAKIAGFGRVVAGSAFICAERTAPGVIDHTAVGMIRLGWLDPAADHPVALGPGQIAAAFNAAKVKCTVYERGCDVKWMKLVWNVPFNGLSVYYGGVTTDVILETPERRAFARRLMEEVIRAAAADGSTVDPSLIESNLTVTAKMAAYRTSMMVDFIQGREVELEPILGEPLRRGRAAGLDLPALSELYEGVRRRLAERAGGGAS